ncbi:hypothetical protein VP01_8306g1 [Puccinia sorghi]|uniref:DUF659 domain-containing protein n=1 Tax=Puccinia sorghi TaxID=27349 RepID=A0A0L6UBT9_9BASI|nr:hypothetical protein VP01_8306g1 [Puccinia sorghi]
MVDLTIAIPHVQGNHSGKNVAELFYGVLKKYDLCNKVHIITADNASTNAKMACELQNKLPTFKASEKLLGFITSFINLSAKDGLEFLGSLDENICHKISMTDMDQTSSVVSISNLTSEPDRCGLELKTVLKQIHGLSTYRAQFTFLEIDVATQWNSTFSMFQQVIQLHASCDHFCKHNSKAKKF